MLSTGTTAIEEGQEEFQAASNILDTLIVFGERLDLSSLGPNRTLLLKEDSFQIQVAEMETDKTENEDMQVFTPNLTSSLPDIQSNAVEMPLQGATIILPSDLLDQLNVTQRDGRLRVLNAILQTDILFVVDRSTDLGQDLQNNTIAVGNLIITASVIGAETIEKLSDSQSIIIRFTLTEVCMYIILKVLLDIAGTPCKNVLP